jgi:predicted NBD/HSP70 family sugar kinase
VNTTKDRTSAAILGHLQRAEGATRADLARALGYSPSTVTAIVGELVAQGRVEEYVATTGRRAVGRPALRLRIRMSGALLAIEFDHDHVSVAVTDQDGSIVSSDRHPVNTAVSPIGAIRTAAELSRQVLGRTPYTFTEIRAAAVGLPGPVDTQTGVVGSSSVLPNWRDANVLEMFRRQLGNVPLKVDNDANLAALGEFTCGSAVDARNFVFVKSSTGVGGCIYLNGEIFRGAYGAAGEIGHLAIPEERTLCHCGNRGCLETVSSTAALLRQARTAYPDATDLAALKVVYEQGGDAIGRSLFDMGGRLGMHLAHLCTILDIDRVVIGGELAEFSPDYIRGAQETITRWIHPQLAGKIRVSGSALGGSAGLSGAAIAARQLAVALP